ncbi:TrmB family transcriptional regulator [Candidatus Woesearchaeota archaeon]|nr:TrmB family transcriptional regulator [Candidatus Woesearchaeota archaeon]
MLIDKKLMERLKDFNLNSYESKIWVALLSRGVSTAGELSDIANVPRSRSYDVLESLEKKGFIIMKLGKPIKYIAVSPNEVIERVKKKIKEDQKIRTSIIDELRESEILEELNLLHTQGVEMIDPSELTASLKGRDNIYNHIELMLSQATSNVSIMTTEQGLIRKAKQLRKTFEKLKQRNVDIKIIAPLTQNHNKTLEELSKYATIKNASSTPSRFILVDDRELMFMLLDDSKVHPSYDVGVWANTPFFAKSIQDMFNSVFETSQKIEVKH